MFIQNGLGVCGLKLTDHQQKILQRYSLYTKIWILDNDAHQNKDVMNQYQKLIAEDERVFIWPKKYSAFKDVNEVCTKLSLNQIKTNFFIENSFKGQKALLKLSNE